MYSSTEVSIFFTPSIYQGVWLSFLLYLLYRPVNTHVNGNSNIDLIHKIWNEELPPPTLAKRLCHQVCLYAK